MQLTFNCDGDTYVWDFPKRYVSKIVKELDEIKKESEVTCPKCGCGSFSCSQTVKTPIIINGTGKIQSYSNAQKTRKMVGPYFCVECGERFDSLYDLAPNKDGEKITTNGYGGFLIVKCESCGTVKAFCPKHKLHSYICDSCKTSTPMVNMTSVVAECKCGRSFSYHTNIKSDTFSIKCIDCGQDIDLVYDRKKGCYVTKE